MEHHLDRSREHRDEWARTDGSRIITNGPGQPFAYPIDVLCSKNYDHCPELEIVNVDSSNTVVSDPAGAQSTIVGKRVHLKARAKPGVGSGSFNVQNARWSMTGDSLVEDYDWANGALTRLNPASFNGHDEVTFYYSIPQTSRTIRVAATLQGATGDTQDTATATDNITGPTMVEMKGELIPGLLDVGSVTGLQGKWLHLGDTLPGSLGIVYHFLANPPSNGSGHFAVTQLVAGQAVGLSVTGNLLYETAGALDGCPAYGNKFVPTDGMSEGVWNSSDSPGMPLNDNDFIAGVQYFFADFFMYRPAGDGSIWIPFGMMTWAVGGIIDRDTSQASGWNMRTEGQIAPSEWEASQFPTWTRSLYSVSVGDSTPPSCTTNPS